MTVPSSAIRSLALIDVGPSGNLCLELSPRLNIIAGDNGVGKTFVLDVLWWCLTGTWSGHAAWPSLDARMRAPTIRVTDAQGRHSSSVFDRVNETWPRPTDWPPTLAPVLYVCLDGRFALWDPLRNRGVGAPLTYEFTTPWTRLYDTSGTLLCNGLIDDWRDWAQRADRTLFERFFEVIKALMPPEDDPQPSPDFVKLSKHSATRMPQLQLRHGLVPIEHLSAGMKRVLGIAYLLIWAWDEHLQAAHLSGTAPTSQIVLLIDEVEAHLHPKWQRTLLPALLRAATGLGDDDLSVQVVATTHSPLVLASLEPHFVQDTDQLLHLGYDDDEVRIEEIPWANHGNASAWLESPVLDLERSTSPELERVLEEAHAFLDDPRDSDTRAKIDGKLRRLLPTMDPFWLQWESPVDEASP
ncbi:MAG: AAA family ATPase [Myxococcota bacterium]